MRLLIDPFSDWNTSSVHLHTVGLRPLCCGGAHVVRAGPAHRELQEPSMENRDLIAGVKFAEGGEGGMFGLDEPIENSRNRSARSTERTA